jgi:hypothetical protein
MSLLAIRTTYQATKHHQILHAHDDRFDHAQQASSWGHFRSLKHVPEYPAEEKSAAWPKISLVDPRSFLYRCCETRKADETYLYGTVSRLSDGIDWLFRLQKSFFMEQVAEGN